jgi:hypothetical protein
VLLEELGDKLERKGKEWRRKLRRRRRRQRRKETMIPGSIKMRNVIAGETKF